jgi:hypothetical protein
MPPTDRRRADLRGVLQLGVAAVHGVTDLVEAVHQSVWSSVGVRGPETDRTGGISGLVYRSVRGVTAGAGQLGDQLLRRAPGADAALLSTARGEALRAVLNGVLGDRLVATANPLATPMTLRQRSIAIDPSRPPPLRRRLLLAIHGLCMNDLQWTDPAGGEPVEALAAGLDADAVYLRYNSGLRIADNGRQLSALLSTLLEAGEPAIETIDVVGHSMGGLVLRSALQQASRDGAGWPLRVRKVVFLGTPHHGAPLERAGHLVELALAQTPWSAPFGRLGRLRSAGITDLRHGSIDADDRPARDRRHSKGGARIPVPLPAGIAFHTVAATLAARRSLLAERLTGDGLVPLRSALGEHDQAGHALHFPPDARMIAYRTGHLTLLHDAAVWAQVGAWLTPSTG